MSTASISLTPVDSKQDLRQFILLQWELYAKDRHWVPPLLIERLEHLSPKHNPYFDHAEWQAWIATRDGKPVGRITAQIDDLYIEHYKKKTGFFGLIEAQDDPEVFKALFSTAETWLKERGIEHIQGPYNLSINQECGLLIDGFDIPPQIMMGHALPFTDSRIRALGYSKAKDLVAYHIDPKFERPKLMLSLIDRYKNRLTIRPLRRKKMSDELDIMRDIFNDAWANNWGFVPFTEAEFQAIGKDLGLLVKDDMVQIAEFDGEPVAFVVVLPNVNESIRDLNGRLLPFGWLKLLYRLKVSFPKTARIPLMGVRQRFHKTRLGPGLTFMIVDAVRQAVLKKGVEDIEMSWVLEDNHSMRNIIESCGGSVYKTYRIYEKSMLPANEQQ